MRKLLLAATLLTVSQAGLAAGIVNPVINGNSLEATVSVAGLYEAELTIEFENTVGLTAANLGLSAELVNVNNSSLINRLPDPSLMGIAGGFPVLITIDPPSNGGFSFQGVASIELYTHDLSFDPAVPLRFFSAEAGGDFHDITELVASGSYRTRGGKGQFSEFLVALDGRSTGSVVQIKFDRVASLLSTFQGEIPGSLHSTLSGHMANAENAFDAGNIAQAIDYVGQFIEAVEAAQGNGTIPDVWRSARDVDNVAGLLRAAASTLRFSLTLASNQL